MKDEKKYETVGNIRIKEPKKKKNNKKSNETSVGIKVFVWFMFIAMTLSFLGPLLYYFIKYALGK